MNTTKSSPKNDEEALALGAVRPEPGTPKIHALASGEKQLLQGLNIMVLNAKGKIHDLNVALEAAQRELASSMAGMNAGLAMVGASNGVVNPTISADFSKITGAQA